MRFYLLQIDPNLLSVTGVIATVLAVIFALGAYNNSRSRKKHIIEMEKAHKQDQAMHFRPPKSHLPSRSSNPGRSSRSGNPSHTGRIELPKAAPIAKASPPPEDDASSRKSSEAPQLFRKVRPEGPDREMYTTQDEDSETYVWE